MIKRTKISGGGVLLESIKNILLIVSYTLLKMEVQSTSNNGLHSSRVVVLC